MFYFKDELIYISEEKIEREIYEYKVYIILYFNTVT